MSCIVKINSPATGKSEISSNFYQLTSFFPNAQAKSIYEATVSENFKSDLGFDWTKPQLGFSLRTNYLGEPKLEIINKILGLNLSEGELAAGLQIEDVMQQGYLNRTFPNKEAFQHIQAQIALNPRYDLIDSEVLSTSDGYVLSIKPAVNVDKVLRPISKAVLADFKFPPFLLNSVEDFNSAQLTELLDSLSTSPEASEFDKEILSRLARLTDVNTKLKLAIFDDFDAPGEYQRSFYDPQSNTIYIGKSIKSNVNNKDLIREIIHEAVHAYTVKVINNPSNAQEVLFVNELVSFYSKFKNNYPELQATYGMQNVEEFVSEYLSNPMFRKALQEAEFVASSKDSFLDRMVKVIKNFLSDVFGRNNSATMYEEVGSLLDGYFDYLSTLRDFPESPGEFQLRFNAPYSNVPQDFQDLGLESFYKYITSQNDSKVWGILSQNLQEIDAQFASLQALRDLFTGIAAPSLVESLQNTVIYTVAINKLLDRIKSDLDLVEQGTSKYTSEQLIKKYHSIIAIGDAFSIQIQNFQQDLTSRLETFVAADTTREDELLATNKREDIRKKDVDNLQRLTQIKEKLQEAASKTKALISRAQEKQIDPAVTILAKHFETIGKELKGKDHPIHTELNQLEHQRAIALGRNDAKQAKKIQEEIDDIKVALSFIPTAKNIKALVQGQTQQSLSNLTIFSRYWQIGGLTGAPVADWINSFINSHLTEAENFSVKNSIKLKGIEERIKQRNKKRGISTQAVAKKFYEGFTRQVIIKYEQPDGTVKEILQKVYQTEFREAEFNNDLVDLRQKLALATASGVDADIQTAQKELETFIENYAQKPYKDEYYEVENLLTEEARTARQSVLERISELSSVFGDEDLAGDLLNPDTQDTPDGSSLRELRAALRSEYLRLGSIYNENGIEKPVGSDARKIADSIKSYNEKRKGLEIIEFVIPEQTLIKFNLIKEGFTARINALEQDIIKHKNDFDLAELENRAKDANDISVLLKDAKQNLETEKVKQEKWLSKNTRVEIKPEFFERQKAISEKISEILGKYAANPRIGEKYQELFDLVKGYRDQDGVIQGSTMSASLGESIKEVEQEIERLKDLVKEERGEAGGFTPEDKKTLSKLFKQLDNLQYKTVTPYYQRTYLNVKNAVSSDIDLDKETIDAIKQKALQYLNEYVSTDGLFHEYDNVINGLQLQYFEQFQGSSIDDYPKGALTPDQFLSQMESVLKEIEVQKRIKETDWYRTNHITTNKGIRPIYIWQKTVPLDPQYIDRTNPTFEWSTPRVREEYKNKEHNFLGEYRPRKDAIDNKYVNDEYTNLDAEDKGIINDVVEMYEEMQRLLPQSQRLVGYQTPNVGRSNKEESHDFIMATKYRAIYLIKSFKLLLQRAIPGEGAEQIEVTIEEMRNIAKSSNVRLIKTRYKEPIQADLSTDLILNGLAQFSNYIAEFAGLQKALPVVFALRDTLQRAAQNKSMTNKPSTRVIKFGEKGYKVPTNFMENTFSPNDKQLNQVLGLVDTQIDYFFYGEDIGRRIKVPTAINNVFEGLLQKTQSLVLKYNPFRTIKNALNNYLQIIANSAATIGVTKMELSEGTLKAIGKRSDLIGIELGTKEYSDYALKLMHFRAVPMADPTKVAANVHLGYVHQYLNWDNWSAQIFDYPEAASTLGIYEVLTTKQKVPQTINGQTNYISISEAYEVVDGRLSPKEGVFGLEMLKSRQLEAEINNKIDDYLNSLGKLSIADLNPEEKIQLNRSLGLLRIKKQELDKINEARLELLRQSEQLVRDKIFQFVTLTQGNYYKRGRSGYQSVIMLKYVMSLKKWLFSSLQNLYGKTRFIAATGTVQQGMYRTLVKSLYKNLLSQKNYLKNTVPKTDREKADYNRVLNNIILTASLLALTVYLVNLYMDECGEEDYNVSTADQYSIKCWFRAFAANIALGTLEEFSSLKPEISPVVSFNKFKSDPLKKQGEKDKGLAKKAMDYASYFFVGSQITQVDKLLDAAGLLLDPIFGETAYVDTSRDGMGGIKPNQYIPAYKGMNPALVGFLKIIGAETFIKQDDQGKLLKTRLKYFPIPFADNPYADYEITLNEIEKIKQSVLKRPRNILLAIEGAFPRDEKGTIIPANELTPAQKEKLNKDLSEIRSKFPVIDLEKAAEFGFLLEQKQKLEMFDKELLAVAENRKEAAESGKKDSKFLEELAEALSGKSKIKSSQKPKSTRVTDAELYEQVYQQLRVQSTQEQLLNPPK